MTETTDRHDEIDELLAGYALRSLTGADAIRADRLLADHVPDCDQCRTTLMDFADLTGELGLAVDPQTPPDLVLQRLRREIAEPSAAATRPGASGRRRLRGGAIVAAAASIVALVVVSGIALQLGSRANRAEDLRARLGNVIDTVRQGGELNPLDGEGGRPDGELVEVSAPQAERMYLYGTEVPQPAPGNVYRAWLGNVEGDWDIAGEFVPDDAGWVVIGLTVDPAYDRIVICEEPVGTAPSTPGPQVRWVTQIGS
ncbi:MAG: anti-sigma factor [Actinomycetota bacterium]